MRPFGSPSLILVTLKEAPYRSKNLLLRQDRTRGVNTLQTGSGGSSRGATSRRPFSAKLVLWLAYRCSVGISNLTMPGRIATRHQRSQFALDPSEPFAHMPNSIPCRNLRMICIWSVQDHVLGAKNRFACKSGNFTRLHWFALEKQHCAGFPINSSLMAVMSIQTLAFLGRG